MKEQVKQVIEEIKPMLEADGGGIELVDVVDGIVKVRLTGACGGCPGAKFTLQMYVEKFLKEKVPAVKGVEAVI